MFTQERDLFERARSFFLGIFDSSGSGMCVYIYICVYRGIDENEREREERFSFHGEILSFEFRVEFFFFFTTLPI